MARGIGFILVDPGRYLLLSLSRVRDYFEFWPTADSSLLFNLGRVLSIGLFLSVILYGLYLSLLRPTFGNPTIPHCLYSISLSSSTASFTFLLGRCLAIVCRWMLCS